jgi:hypothetical protein
MQSLPKQVPAFDQLLSLEKIEQKDLAILSPNEKDEFINLVHRKALDLDGRELELFIKKAAALLDNDFIWEINHHRIMDAIRDLSSHFNRMPSKVEIAIYAGLNRKTVSMEGQCLNKRSASAVPKVPNMLFIHARVGAHLNP